MYKSTSHNTNEIKVRINNTTALDGTFIPTINPAKNGKIMRTNGNEEK